MISSPSKSCGAPDAGGGVAVGSGVGVGVAVGNGVGVGVGSGSLQADSTANAVTRITNRTVTRMK